MQHDSVSLFDLTFILFSLEAKRDFLIRSSGVIGYVDDDDDDNGNNFLNCEYFFGVSFSYITDFAFIY